MVKLRPFRLVALGIWGAIAPALVIPVLWSAALPSAALAAIPSVKTAQHRGAFALALPAGPTRVALSVAYEPKSRGLTLSVRDQEPTAERVFTVPEFVGSKVRSEFVPLAGGETALVLSFGEPKPYVLVLLAPRKAEFLASKQSATKLGGSDPGNGDPGSSEQLPSKPGDSTSPSEPLADAVVLKGFLVGADGVEASLTTSEAQDGFRLILSEPDADRGELCGHVARSTRTLDAVRGRFVRVAVPLLGSGERKAAKKLSAKLDAGGRDIYLGQIPSAFETDALELDPLLDARTVEPALPYEAQRVSLPEGADVAALVVDVAETPADDATWDLWLWTERGVFEVETSDLRGAPSIVVDLPEELRSGCLAVGVGARSPFVEVRGRLPADAPALAAAGTALAAPAGELALRELAPRAAAVLLELTAGYSSLADGARTQAEALARLVEPRLAEAFWVRQLLDGNEGERIRGRARLTREEDGGRAALGRALRAAQAKDELPLAQTLAELAPAAALRPIAFRLTQRSPARRLELRKVLADLTADPAFLAEASALLTDSSISRKQKLEVLRALAPAVRRLTPAAQTAAKKLLSSATYEEAFVLVPVVLGFGDSVPEARDLLLAWSTGARLEVSPRELAALQTEILTLAAEQEACSAVLSRRALALLDDPFVRVRASAAACLAVSHGALGPEPKLAAALAARAKRDEWPAVREASLGALGSLRRDAKLGAVAETAEAAVLRALAKDPEPSVRSRAARTLTERPTEASLTALRRSLTKDDHAAVQAEAARSLGLLCDQEALGALTAAARGITRGARDEADVRLALNAVTALSRLDPPDLAARIAPLTTDSVPGPLRGRVERAVEAGRGGCAATKKR